MRTQATPTAEKVNAVPPQALAHIRSIAFLAS
jgi:hypothetical protein